MGRYLGKVDVHNGGHVVLEKSMGSDIEIVNNARVSFNEESDTMDDRNAGLINFLMRERHGSPFEAPVFRFDIKCPVFVAREWMRHRIGSFNEWSARYSELSEEFYVPEPGYVRRRVGKPGAYTYEPIEDKELVEAARTRMYRHGTDAFQLYRDLVNQGVALEVARDVLPVSHYTRFKWTVNLRALLNFLSLRNAPEALWEIRDYAVGVEDLATPICPETFHCFNKHNRVCP
jgi:thymidylate synthase (FAD)